MNYFIDLHREKIFILYREKWVKTSGLCDLIENLLRYGAEEEHCKNSEKKNVYNSGLLYSILNC